jgi:hypothetical protein
MATSLPRAAAAILVLGSLLASAGCNKNQILGCDKALKPYNTLVGSIKADKTSGLAYDDSAFMTLVNMQDSEKDAKLKAALTSITTAVSDAKTGLTILLAQKNQNVSVDISGALTKITDAEHGMMATCGWKSKG